MVGSMASSSRSPRDTEGACHGLDAAVPPRVENCLKNAKDFGNFKNLRGFRFLHLFAGPKDVLQASASSVYHLHFRSKDGLQ